VEAPAHVEAEEMNWSNGIKLPGFKLSFFIVYFLNNIYLKFSPQKKHPPIVGHVLGHLGGQVPRRHEVVVVHLKAEREDSQIFIIFLQFLY
jgi:hypothetical protein